MELKTKAFAKPRFHMSCYYYHHQHLVVEAHHVSVDVRQFVPYRVSVSCSVFLVGTDSAHVYPSNHNHSLLNRERFVTSTVSLIGVSWRFELHRQGHNLKTVSRQYGPTIKLVEDLGFEPRNARIKTWCVRPLRQPSEIVQLTYILGRS